MERNMELVRSIVLAVKKSPGALNSIPDVSPEEFAYHAQILQEAGLLMAALMPDSKAIPQRASILRLTWSGHDFADSIIDETIWNKAKDNVIKPASSWTFGILLEYLSQEIKSGFPSLGM